MFGRYLNKSGLNMFGPYFNSEARICLVATLIVRLEYVCLLF